MKSITKSSVLLLIMLMMTGSAMLAQELVIHVSPTGDDANPGSKEKPVATLAHAQRMVREYRRLHGSILNRDIHLELAEGTYFLPEPLRFRPEDGGTEESMNVYKAAEGAQPEISGGVPVENWKKYKGKIVGLPAAAKGKIWAAPLPVVNGNRVKSRQLWVNSVKATRASSLNNGPLPRIIEVNKEEESFLIDPTSFTFQKDDQLEFVIHQWWAIAILRVKDIVPEGDYARITFHQPESQIEFEHPWPAPFMDETGELNGNSAYYFVNSPALLDSPGEWYLDEQEGMIYYWPRESENMTRAEVIMPHLENLVSIEGTLDNPVEHLVFDGLHFKHTGWMRPSEKGHVPLQAGMYLLEAYKLHEPGTEDKASLENQAWTGRQPAAVHVKNAAHIYVSDCSFRHLAATGIDMETGVSESEIQGCILSDIGGTAIQSGYFGGIEHEAHMPYDPVDERELCHHITISNNLLTNATNEDWGCVGISIGYAHDISIMHNEVSHLNYSGICLGWGWTRTIMCMENNLVHANNIHHFAKMMYDVGGVYTLSAQPNTEISENSIHHLEKAPYAHIPEHYQYIYFDEGSSYIRAINNWTEKDKFFSNTPGPGNEWKNNGPQVDIAIKNAAGLEPAYQHLLKEYEKPWHPYKE